MANTFNSNFDCRCNTSSNFQLGSSKYIFQKNLDDLKKDNKFNIIDENGTIMDDLIQPSFKYYQNHEFHKLCKKKKPKNIFGVFYSNICSLQANFDNLQNLINNLGHQFSVIAVSETWTPEGKKQNLQYDLLEGY